MKNIKKFFLKYKFLFIGIILLCLIVLLFILFYSHVRKELTYNNDWLDKNINITLNSDFGDNVYSVSMPDDVSVFTENYQSIIDKKIKKLFNSSNYSFDNPLIIYNPYGTNNSGVNVYFKDDGDDYSYSVKTDYNTFNRDLNVTDGKVKEYQLIGLVAGCNNKVVIRSSNKNYSFNIKIPSTSSGIDVKLKSTKNNNENKLEDGLYAILGHDKSFNSNIYLYDNDGVLRSELVLDSYRSDRIVFYNDYMIYCYKKNGFIMVDRMGKIVSFYDISGYNMHHDFVLDGDKLVILVNKNGSDTIEDVVISLDLNSGRVNELIDMKNYFNEYYKTAIKPKGGNTYGGDELDWIHLNSLQVSNDSIYLSSRELSMVIKMNNIYNNPKIDYILADDSIITDKYKKYSYKKVGDFVSQAGQHSITYTSSDISDDENYYLTVYNNNFGNMRTRPSFDWSNFRGVGSYSEGDCSYVYKYLVNEKKKIYELVSSFRVPYSSVVSNMQYYGENIVTSSGKDHSFAEYSSDGGLIKQFDYTSKKYAYRVFKYNFKIWFK